MLLFLTDRIFASTTVQNVAEYKVFLTQTRVGSKGHWCVMLEVVKLEKLQCVSKLLPSKAMDLMKETDKPKAEANPSKPARKLRISRTHICMENISTRTFIIEKYSIIQTGF